MKFTRSLHPFALGLFLASTASAQVTRRVSVSSAGAQSNSSSDYSWISSDGSFVAFRTFASNLAAGDPNGFRDVYCRALLNGQTGIVSVASDETPGNQASGPQSVSADGRYVAFSSSANNLVPGDTNGGDDIFLRDRVAGTTQRISVSSAGAQGNGNSISAAISADGNYVAYRSSSTNLVPGDTNGVDDIFVSGRLTGITERISLDSAEVQANSTSDYPSISADGRYVAFASGADNLQGAGNDLNGAWDIFRRDRISGFTAQMSVTIANGPGNDHSLFPSISADGDSVAFYSASTNLVGAADTNGVPDVFFHSWSVFGSTRIVSVSSGETPGNGVSGAPSLSADGRYVAFESLATNLVGGDTNGAQDIFVRDLLLGTTERVSLSSGGVEPNAASSWPSISGDGRFVAFESLATNLVLGDTNASSDIFLRDRDATAFTSLCHPGIDGAQPCPCSNQPSLPDRGCDNSSATGGALVSASGAAYLSMDSLVFTTTGERPTALSIVLQGNGFVPAGINYGQGVRCAGGSLKRLFVKTASSGSITAPGAGDPTVSAQSAAKGDPIQPGQSRWYLVYYRDPNVLGGCPASSTFNATQTGRVAWRL